MKELKKNIKHQFLNQNFIIPKCLVLEPDFKGLSHSAIICYGMLRQKENVAIKNNWIDENGDIYLSYSKKEMAEILNVTERTMYQYLKELENFGLVKKEVVGGKKVNRLYVLEVVRETKGEQKRKKKQMQVDDALAIGSLGGVEVAPEDMKLLQKFIDGAIELKELLEKAIECHTVK